MDLRELYGKRLIIRETQPLDAKDERSWIETQLFSSEIVYWAHFSREHFCARMLSSCSYIFGESCKMDQLLDNFTITDKCPPSLFTIEYAFVDQFRDGLASCHTADTIFFA